MPKNAPSIPWKRELGGVYVSRQLGQKSWLIGAYLDCVESGHVKAAAGQYRLGVAVNTRADAELSLFKLVNHLLHSLACDDIALVD